MDAVFGAFQRHHQVAKRTVDTQGGVALGHDHQARQGAGQLALGLLELAEPSGLFRVSGVTWMAVALARASTTLVSVSCSKLASPLTVATMVGCEVGPALILVEHFAPRGLGLLVQALEVVVPATAQCERGSEQGEEGKERRWIIMMVGDYG